MTESTYEVVFSGEVKKGLRRSVVQDQLRSRLKLSRRESKDLFSGRDRVLKRTVHQASAEQLAGILDEAGALYELRRSPVPASDGAARDMVALDQTSPGPKEQTLAHEQRDLDMRTTLREFLRIPVQTATGSWLSLRLRRSDGASTRDLTAIAAATMGRLRNGHHDRTGRSYAIGRVVGGTLMAVPTAGVALGVSSGMLLDGALVAGVLNMLFFGSIAAYGIWLVVTGVRYARGLAASPAPGAASPSTPVPVSDNRASGWVNGSSRRQEPATDGEWVHPGIHAFMGKSPRMAEPCTFECRGTHLWGTTKDRRCENVSLLLASVAACLFAGFWIPDFLNVAFGLLLLILVAVVLSRLSTKPTRQFHLDVATDPPLWFSNDDEFWRPVMTFFKLKDTPRRRSWLKRRNGKRAARSGA